MTPDSNDFGLNLGLFIRVTMMQTVDANFHPRNRQRATRINVALSNANSRSLSVLAMVSLSNDLCLGTDAQARPLCSSHRSIPGIG